MKTLILGLTTLAITSSFSTHAEWSLLKMLREEPQPPPQRVAFIGSARVEQIHGKVERLSGIDTWSPVNPGFRLEPGDMLRTQNGSATIRMSDSKSFVKITPNTILRLVPLEKNGDPASLTGSEDHNGFVVRSCRGSAVFRDAGEWKPVIVNTVLPESAIIRTDPGSTVDLFSTITKHAVRIDGSQQIELANAILVRRPASSLAAINR